MRIIISFLLVCNFIHAQQDLMNVYDSKTLIKQGIELYEKKEFEKSIELFDKVAKTDFDYNNALFEKCMALRALKKNEELTKIFEGLSKETFTEFPRFYAEYGIFLSENNQLDKALEAFDEGLKLIPNSTSLLFNKSIVLIKKEDNQNALKLLKKVIILDPKHASSQYFFGVICLEEGYVAQGYLTLMNYLLYFSDGKFAENTVLTLRASLKTHFFI